MLVIGESFSPWTKKARWALERCGVDYDYEEYVPTLSEPKLRWRLRQFTGSVSVPVAIDGQVVQRGSWDIARYGAQVAGENLLGDWQQIAPWNDLSEDALAAGRTRVVRAIKDDQIALRESLPSFIPPGLRSSLTFVARDAVRRLDRKYAHLVRPDAIETALEATRAQLQKSNAQFLLGQFSYADIAMAAVLEVIQPIARVEPPLGPATSACWLDRELAEKYPDLIAWRDQLAASESTNYSQFRRM